MLKFFKMENNIFNASIILLKINHYVICQICDSYHNSFEELNAHYERDHPTGKTSSKQELRTEYEKYKCELCEVCFSQKKSVLRHQQQVHGRKPGPKRKKNQGTVRCEYCDKLFYDKPTVIKHRKRIHKIY